MQVLAGEQLRDLIKKLVQAKFRRQNTKVLHIQIWASYTLIDATLPAATIERDLSQDH